MFFFLSKVLQYLISPVIWIIVLFLSGLILRNKKISRKLLISSLSMLFFFTNPFIFQEIMRLWEPGITLKKDLKTSYDYGIVLSGMLTYDKKNETINFGTATDRILQTLELYKEGYIEKIFISGGSGEVFNQEFKESLILKELLITLDIPENDIIIDLKSRNTYENAIETAKILNPKENNSTYLLITSGFHMRRATGCYKKQGFDFDIYTTDNYSQSRLFTPDMLIVPQPLALSGWTLLIHEITGFIVYKIAGYC